MGRRRTLPAGVTKLKAPPKKKSRGAPDIEIHVPNAGRTERFLVDRPLSDDTKDLINQIPSLSLFVYKSSNSSISFCKRLSPTKKARASSSLDLQVVARDHLHLAL